MKKIKYILTLAFCGMCIGFNHPTKRFTASYYADRFEGRKTANGDVYRHHHLTAASNVFPLNTKVIVQNVNTGDTVTVKINDRIHKRFSHRIDLSKRAFEKIESVEKGLVRVNLIPCSN